MISRSMTNLASLIHFFKGLKDDDVIILRNDKDSSCNKEVASYLYHKGKVSLSVDSVITDTSP